MSDIIFEDYTGYDKGFYDVLMQDGFVHPQIWPNAGRFRDRNGDVLFDDMVHDPDIIKTRESPIHFMEVDMGGKMTLADYEEAVSGKEAYIERRKPVADAEHAVWEQKREEEDAAERALYPSMSYAESPEATTYHHHASPRLAHDARKQRRLDRKERLDIAIRAAKKKKRLKNVALLAAPSSRASRHKAKKLAHKVAKIKKKKGRK